MIVYHNLHANTLCIAAYDECMKVRFCYSLPYKEGWSKWEYTSYNTLNVLRKDIIEKGQATIVYDNGEK